MIKLESGGYYNMLANLCRKQSEIERFKMIVFFRFQQK